MNRHNLGYYRCNNVDFGSKVNAMLYSRTVNQPVQWRFHQEIFSRWPWQVEPTSTLDELYDRRARQLRENYDYIVLSFSGGADTNNILMSFARQGLHIDEVVTNHMTQATQRFTVLDPRHRQATNFAAEHQLQAVPRLQWIRDNLPRTRITELDVSEQVIKGLADFQDVDWVLNRNDHLSVGQLFRYNYFHFGEIKKKFDQGKKVAIIVGLDKPKTFVKDNEFYILFVDSVANITTINDFNSDYDNVTTELFYWSPECAELLCKQAHVIKRWVESNPKLLPYWTSNDYRITRLYHERWLRPLLYSTWDDSWFQADKSTAWWHTEFDTWFRSNPEYRVEVDLWQKGLEYLHQQLPDMVKRNQQGELDTFRTFGHSYCIGAMNIT